MKPFKFAFSIAFIKFLDYMVKERDIEANSEMNKALIEMRSPKVEGDIDLIEWVAALRHFVSKATNKCLSFFKIFKEWTKLQ